MGSSLRNDGVGGLFAVAPIGGEGRVGVLYTQGRPNERPLRQVSVVELETSQKWYRRKSGGREE